MGKYIFEFKLQVVQAYLTGEGSYNYLSKNMTFFQKRILGNG